MRDDSPPSSSSTVEITGLELLQNDSRGDNVRKSRSGDYRNGLDRSAHSSSSSSSTTFASYANDSFGIIMLKQKQQKQLQLTLPTSGTTDAAASELDDRNRSWHSSFSMQSYCNDSFQLLQISKNATSSTAIASLNHHPHPQPRHYTRFYTRRPVPVEGQAEASSAPPPAAPDTNNDSTTPRITNKTITAKGQGTSHPLLSSNNKQNQFSSPPPPLGQWSLYPSQYHSSCSSSSDDDDSDDDEDYADDTTTCSDDNDDDDATTDSYANDSIRMIPASRTKLASSHNKEKAPSSLLCLDYSFSHEVTETLSINTGGAARVA